MEVAANREPGGRVRLAYLAREPLLWAALAAFVGVAIGLAGTAGYANVMTSFDSGLSTMLFATAAQYCGEALAALSLFGVPALLGDGSGRVGRRAAVVGGVVFLVFFLAAGTAFFYLWYANTGERVGTPDPFPRFSEICFWISVFTPPAVVVPFAAAALRARRWRLAALLVALCVLCLPLGVIWFYLRPEGSYVMPSAAPWLLGLMGTGVGIPESPLWIFLGITLLRCAGGRARRKAERLVGEENRKKALRLYGEGLGHNDLSVVDELVSEDFRDLHGGSRGRLGMERIITYLWTSYPDLSVAIEGQSAEGDLVRTRLLLSGTDRGGVMWYPPTHRTATFHAEFVDRFSEGKLVEHGGEADTEGLLRQLGHREGDETGARPSL